MRRPLVVAVAGLALAGLALTGSACGRQRSPEEVLAAAPAVTTRQGTSRVALDVALPVPPRAHVRGQGVFDHRARRGRFVVDLSALGLPAGSGRAQVLLADDVVFLALPPQSPGAAPTPWLKVDAAAVARRSGVDVGGLRELGDNDPTTALNFLRGVSEEVDEVGEERLRGVETTRYRAVVDLTEAARETPEGLDAGIARFMERLGTSALPVDVWVDREGRLRKLRYRVDLSATGRAEGGSGVIVTTLELYGFGVRVDVREPPADEVTDLSRLLGTRPG